MWKSFLETFEGTNLDYQFLCNITPETRKTDLDVDVIFFPLAVVVVLLALAVILKKKMFREEKKEDIIEK